MTVMTTRMAIVAAAMIATASAATLTVVQSMETLSALGSTCRSSCRPRHGAQAADVSALAPLTSPLDTNEPVAACTDRTSAAESIDDASLAVMAAASPTH